MSFEFSEISPEKAILESLNSFKAAGIDIPGEFLKDGADILARPIFQLWNLSIVSLEVVNLQNH